MLVFKQLFTFFMLHSKKITFAIIRILEATFWTEDTPHNDQKRDLQLGPIIDAIHISTTRISTPKRSAVALNINNFSFFLKVKHAIS
jgi:hypothetical protein